MLRGVLGCLLMKLARSRPKNRRRADAKVLLHVGFGWRPAVQARVEMDKREILALLRREGVCRATHASHPIQLFVGASTDGGTDECTLSGCAFNRSVQHRF
jgi:hypothetical protein